jgi:hypothetical protein
LERHFFAAGAVDIEERRAREIRMILEQPQWLAILSKRSSESRCLLSRKADNAHLCDHDGPAENRDDGEKREDDFAGNGRVFEREGKTAGRQDDRK